MGKARGQAAARLILAGSAVAGLPAAWIPPQDLRLTGRDLYSCSDESELPVAQRPVLSWQAVRRCRQGDSGTLFR